jgi:hypothetical protein
VILSLDYGPSTRPENYPQSAAALFHAKERGCKVVALTFWPGGEPIGEELLKDTYGSDFPDVPEYGTEVVYLGYVSGAEIGMRTFGSNTAAAKGSRSLWKRCAKLAADARGVKVLQISAFGLRLPLELLVNNK